MAFWKLDLQRSWIALFYF